MPEETPQKIVFPGRFDSLDDVRDFVARAAKEAGFSPATIYEMQMAADEAFSNIVEHAYGGEVSGDVECTCCVEDDALVMTLRDHGIEFDPASVPPPVIDGDLEERDYCGLGLYFMNKLMDEVHFEFDAESGNVLTMVKRRETDS